MLNPFFVIPEKKSFQYNPSKPNTLVIDIMVKDPPKIKWSQDTLEELSDKKHLATIKKARLEYKSGDLVSEEEILHKLNN